MVGTVGRHSFYPYFEGISSKSFEQYRLEENEEYYNLTQEQRHNERKIREWDKRNKICEAAGVDNSKELSKVREWKYKQKQFLEEHPELKRDYAREKIYVTNKKDYKPIFNDSSKFKSTVTLEKYDGIPDIFKYDKKKEENLIDVFIAVDKQSLKDGYEYIGILDRKTGKPLFPIHTDNSSKNVTPSKEMISYILNAKANSVTTVHNHPSKHTISIGDIITHNNIIGLGETIVVNNEGVSYFFSIPKGARIDLTTKELEDAFRNEVKAIRQAIQKENANLSPVEINHLALKTVCVMKGWLYGRKRI